MTQQPIVVWSEIPVSDMQKSIAFYETVFGYDMKLDETGPNPIAVLGSALNAVGGHLYPGKPAEAGQGPTLHLAVPGALEDAATRCAQAGGTVLSGPVAIPPGRFVYARDPDGNSLGLFEPKVA
ncbi:VOC family protein [Thalassovita mangrovi]|uniref:VOC family protein n=1 Tax=Thalassovita mangrovi TaxID=2692236 RepID=A0A6L8LGM2_9RHOB|nr:VOC family protein [Thalassovita mangrovi]MYM55098.1 VOC family protein [Thalassovita mangrovi]